MHILVDHVEVGLLYFDLSISVEINRVMTDYISEQLYSPTQTTVDNPATEWVTTGVHLIGDVMVDTLKNNWEIIEERSHVTDQLGLSSKQYLVLTFHRPTNIRNRENIINIVYEFNELDMPFVFPVHPRTRKSM